MNGPQLAFNVIQVGVNLGLLLWCFIARERFLSAERRLALLEHMLRVRADD